MCPPVFENTSFTWAGIHDPGAALDQHFQASLQVSGKTFLTPFPHRSSSVRCSLRASALQLHPWYYTVGTVPPSMMYSVPVMEAARGEAR